MFIKCNDKSNFPHILCDSWFSSIESTKKCILLCIFKCLQSAQRTLAKSFYPILFMLCKTQNSICKWKHTTGGSKIRYSLNCCLNPLWDPSIVSNCLRTISWSTPLVINFGGRKSHIYILGSRFWSYTILEASWSFRWGKKIVGKPDSLLRKKIAT